MQDTANDTNGSGFCLDLKARLCAVQQRMSDACSQSGRSVREIQLLAVSKTRSASEIRALHALGVRAFGENHLTEAQAKQTELDDLALAWHFIGPIQSNKTRVIAQQFDWVQSVDREKIIHRLADQRPSERPPLNVLIQVNIDEEPQKAGCSEHEISDLADLIAAQSRLRLRGLMAIPAADAAQSQRAFERMHVAFAQLARECQTIDTLSIGMSGDLEAAIAAGSSMIRIGTALFGPRPATNA
ncbi:MAG: YggS family pyridoxal phosphate-dependent enzyme [Pseudomonadota bacterium]